MMGGGAGYQRDLVSVKAGIRSGLRRCNPVSEANCHGKRQKLCDGANRFRGCLSPSSIEVRWRSTLDATYLASTRLRTRSVAILDQCCQYGLDVSSRAKSKHGPQAKAQNSTSCSPWVLSKSVRYRVWSIGENDCQRFLLRRWRASQALAVFRSNMRLGPEETAPSIRLWEFDVGYRTKDEEVGLFRPNTPYQHSMAAECVK
ncbi:hypothetical protein LZ30DRAFT_768280 [Colletotrichum cereale]|nr:hypothetical protein LZ30DRAFT_768280 [Colletotrichum cereale]